MSNSAPQTQQATQQATAPQTQQATQQATAPQTQQATQQATDWKAEYDRLKADARKWEARAKENYEARKKLDEIEEASKTEAQRQADALAAAHREASEAKAYAAILETANAKGVPADLLKGPGDNFEEYADRLKAYIDQQAIKAAPQMNNSSAPHIPAGKVPEQAGTLTIDEQIAAAAEADDKKLVARLKAMKLGQALKP